MLLHIKQEIKGVGQRNKVRKMQWCLAEAHRNIDKKHIRASSSIALIQDVRAAKLLVRYRATAPKGYRTRRGILGVISVPDGSSLKLKDATLQVLAEASTIRAQMPYRPLASPAVFDKKAFAHLCVTVDQFTADSAADEQLTGQLLREYSHNLSPATLPGTALKMYAPICPNIKVISRDRAHACARVLKRPWHASEKLRVPFQTYIWGKKSISATIHNSHTFRQWFGDDIKRRKRGRVQNLSIARHRLLSCVKVCRRFCFFFRSICRTASRIASHRVGKVESIVAQDFLRDITVLDVLLIACMGLGASETQRLMRVMDVETFDSAEESFVLERCWGSINALFNDGGCCWKVGLAYHVLNMLKSGVSLNYGGHCRVLGGHFF